MDATEMLTKARRKIKWSGWAQGRSKTRKPFHVFPSYCMTGATFAVDTNASLRGQAHNFLLEAIAIEFPESTGRRSVMSWNDTRPFRWKGRKQVLKVYKTAIELSKS